MLQKWSFSLLQLVPYGAINNLYTTAGTRRIVPINNQDFRYLRFRAIGCMEDPNSGHNGNYDGFPYEHFEDERPNYGYKSFIGKRAHVEHNSSEGIAGSIGDLPDAFLNRFIILPQYGVKRYADLLGPKNDQKRLGVLNMPNQKDGSIEVLMRIDVNLTRDASTNEKAKRTADRIVRMIDTGQKLACSMGTNIEYSVCATCGNLAHFASEYCDHIAKRKGAISVISANQVRDLLSSGAIRPEWLQHLMISKMERNDVLQGYSSRNVAMRNVEMNHVLSFFELSIVGNPAFTRAQELERIASLIGGKSQATIEWEKLTDEDMIKFVADAQDRCLISVGCNLT